MAGGDRAVDVHIYLPAELLFLVEQYQIGSRSVSKSEAFRRLLETHPKLAEIAAKHYTETNVQAP